MPTQSTNPITLADNAVVELDPVINYEVLNVFQGKYIHTSHLPTH